MKTIKKNPLLARLRDLAAPAQSVPANFKTCLQWAKEWDMHAITARRLLMQGVSNGLIVQKSFRIRLPDGRTYPTPHYAEKQGG